MPIRKLTRRGFLKVSAAAGVAMSTPWLVGCGDGNGDDSADPVPRESASLNFDLGRHDLNAPYVLHAIGSRSNRMALAPHTVATRARVRAQHPSLHDIADDDLTHFIDEAMLPADQVQHIWVTREDTGRSVLVLSHIWVPRAARGEDGNDRAVHISARDSALAVIFHHPEVIRLDLAQAALVTKVIKASPLLDALAEIIDDLGDDWIVATPAVDIDDKPVLDKSGKQFIQWDPSDDTLAAADAVVRNVLERVFNTPGLEGANWHLNTGRTTVVVPSASERAAQPEPDDNGAFKVAAHYPAGTWLHGLLIDDLVITDPGSRSVALSVKNTWLRYLGAYVEFYDAAGKRLDQSPGFSKGDLDVPFENPRFKTATFVTVLGSNNDYLGIPVRSADLAPVPIRIKIPPSASRARVIFASLGLGGESFQQHATLGTTLTLVANIGIPALLTALAVGADTNLVVADIFKDPKLWLELVARVGLDLRTSVVVEDARPVLIALGKQALAIAMKTCPALASRLAVIIASENLTEAVPFIGWGLKAARVAATVAELSQTVGEVLSGPALFDNDITLTMDTTVTIKPDKNDFQFPATANRYVIRATYDKSVKYDLTGPLASTRSEPIVETFRNVPSGGKGQIEVWFLTDTNWIAGYGTTGPYVNTVDVASQLAITITENLVPLTKMTQYHHRQKLVYEGGHYKWAPSGAPRQTQSSLNCDAQSLCALNAITVSQDLAMVGYAWRAPAPQGTVCGTGSGASSLQRIQNLSLRQSPEAALKVAHCGYTGKPVIAYELLIPNGKPGRYFYVDPTGGAYHVRGITLDATTPFDLTQNQSWGRFSQAVDSIAIHPAGYVAGISIARHKLQILTLPTAAMPDADAVASVLKAGQGTRVGLLETPLAVGVDLKSHAILVLEGGNARIQAFDVHGNAVNRFANDTKPSAPLFDPPGANVTYLDMAVESTGYVYVLSLSGEGTRVDDYRLDIYDPDGVFVSRTVGVNAARVALDLWRNLYTLNYEPIVLSSGPEPSVSQWIPSTPDGCSQAQNPFCQKY